MPPTAEQQLLHHKKALSIQQIIHSLNTIIIYVGSTELLGVWKGSGGAKWTWSQGHEEQIHTEQC